MEELREISPKKPAVHKPVQDVDFWEDRIYRQVAQKGMLHHIIYDESYEVWRHVQSDTARLLRYYVKRGQSLLDAGCGYGALLDCLQEAHLCPPYSNPVRYLGADLSPHLIRLARLRYPSSNPPEKRPRGEFVVADLRRLDFLRDGSFDWSVCRSIKQMLVGNLGQAAWDEVLAELRRVARRVLLIEYPTKVGELSVEEVIE